MSLLYCHYCHYLALPPCLMREEEEVLYQLASRPHLGGADEAHFPAFQREPDVDQAEQQHVPALRRDGLLADERRPRKAARGHIAWIMLASKERKTTHRLPCHVNKVDEKTSQRPMN